ncbi:HipA domain-containing protein [Gaopeijia maritima]|uniref:type II toxin-antitoxin system HipA family toxin n=1 Tax=Gaopeijia maritima TaxID=3119007 RepID=UPI00324523DF
MTSLSELRGVERAVVYKSGVRAATLERRPNAVAFQYEPDYLAAGGQAVATSLPLGEERLVTHSAGALPPFFAGLLPEGRRLHLLRSALKTSADDELSLLLAVGADTVGDVQVIPEHVALPDEVQPTLLVEDWATVRFREFLVRSAGGAMGVDRVALPGVQDKVSARMINLPVARRGERFFLKLDPPEFPHLVVNDMFFLRAARQSGLETAEAELVRDGEGVPGLLVRRFDRRADATGRVRARAQEDACQVLKRYPADKYRVTTEAVIEALVDLCRARPVAALALIRQVAFAYLSCNGDAHAKNFSIFARPDGEWRVTPAYDLPSSYPYGDVTMALSLNGRTREDIGRRDFLALAEAVRVRPRAVETALDALVAGVDRWIGGLNELPFDAGRIRKLRRAIEYRRDRLRER